MTRTNLQQTPDALAQRAVLLDPVAFGKEIYSCLIGGVFDVLLCRDIPLPTWELIDAARGAVEAAVDRGDAAAFRAAFDLLGEISTNAMTEAASNAMMLGAAFERLREDLLAYLTVLDRGAPTDNEQDDAERVARIRAAMVAETA